MKGKRKAIAKAELFIMRGKDMLFNGIGTKNPTQIAQAICMLAAADAQRAAIIGYCAFACRSAESVISGSGVKRLPITW